MFIYTDTKICVLAAHRCGSTSMYGYFGLPLYIKSGNTKFNFSDWNTMVDESITKVLVLRNPYQRIQSAIKNTEYISQDSEYQEHLKNSDSKFKWTIKHSEPYLHNITCEDFYIIDFDNLSRYINKDNFTVTTNSVISEWQPEFAEYYSPEDLATEYTWFEKYSHQPNIMPSVWKNLTETFDKPHNIV